MLVGTRQRSSRFPAAPMAHAEQARLRSSCTDSETASPGRDTVLDIRPPEPVIRPFRFEWGGQILANRVRFPVTGPAPRREPVAARPSEASPRTRFPKGSAVDVNGRTVSCAAISSDPRRTTARERPAPDGEPGQPVAPWRRSLLDTAADAPPARRPPTQDVPLPTQTGRADKPSHG